HRTNHSSVRPQGVDDLQAREVSFVFGDNHAIIRFSDCGNDHVEGAPGPSLVRLLERETRQCPRTPTRALDVSIGQEIASRAASDWPVTRSRPQAAIALSTAWISLRWRSAPSLN